jgi:lysophospholipase L1-like esterase
MNPWIARAVILAASVVMIVIRAPHVRRSRGIKVTRGMPDSPRSTAILAVIVATALAATPLAQRPAWFSAWMAAPNIGEVIVGLANSTVRTIVRPTISGEALRIKLDNSRASTPVTFSAAFVGRSATAAAIVPGTNRPLTFNGSATVTIPPGGAAWSDPADFSVAAFQRLTVSLNVEAASDVSMHALGLVSSYRAGGAVGHVDTGSGFTALSSTVPKSRTVEYPIYWVSAVDVRSVSAGGTIVAIGDSWIDGRCSTTDAGVVQPDLYRRWLDVLATRLAARWPDNPLAVVNAGIGGNRLIPPGGNGPTTLERLDRDVLERAGVTHVIALQGMNDLGQGTGVEPLITAMREVIDRVHARGLPIIGATLFPMARPDRAGWTSSMEEQRLAVNAWIRTRAAYDGVIDFDRLMSRGPTYDGRASLPPAFGCDDLVHPNADGYRAMGEFVDPDLFRPRALGR